LGRKRPDGRKIAELRKKKGIKQFALAKGACSERLLRDIENRNHPVAATTITDIATALGVTPGEITLTPADETPRNSGSILLLKLRPRSATDLSYLARHAQGYYYALKVVPRTETAADMQAVMLIIRRFVEREVTDEFDGKPFSDIPRLARLQALLDNLSECGVGVIAGIIMVDDGNNNLPRELYTLGNVRDDPFDRSKFLFVKFVPREVEQEVVELSDLGEDVLWGEWSIGDGTT
jgi:transcriptional regulator with XRE-family HTH domain